MAVTHACLVMLDTRTPYQRYSDFARTVAGIQPKSEEDWERDSNRTFLKLPNGASTKQLADLIHDNRARALQRKQATSEQTRQK